MGLNALMDDISLSDPSTQSADHLALHGRQTTWPSCITHVALIYHSRGPWDVSGQPVDPPPLRVLKADLDSGPVCDGGTAVRSIGQLHLVG